MLDGVASEEAVGGSVGSDAVLVAKDLHGRLLNPNTAFAEEVVGQFGICPVGAVNTAGGRSIDDSLLQEGCKVVGEFGCSAGTFADTESFESAFEVGVEPSLDRAGRDA